LPGAGLAIRIPGEVTKEKLDLLREVDTFYLDAIRKAGLYDQPCALRAVTSTDGMTADYYPFEHAFLGRVASRIINECRGINRVTYDITSKPPGTIEWE